MRVVETLEQRIEKYFLEIKDWNYLVKIDNNKYKGVRYESIKSMADIFKCPYTSVYIPVKRLAAKNFFIYRKSQIIYTRIVEKPK